MDFKKLFGTIILSALFVLAMMSFAGIVQVDNDANQTIFDNELINRSYSDLYGNLSDSRTDSQSAMEVFGGITPTENIGDLDVTAVNSPTKVFKSMIVGTYNILIRLPMKVLGVSPIVASVISSIIILLIIIGIWAIWKGAIQ